MKGIYLLQWKWILLMVFVMSKYKVVLVEKVKHIIEVDSDTPSEALTEARNYLEIAYYDNYGDKYVDEVSELECYVSEEL